MDNRDVVGDSIANTLLLDFYGQLLTERSLEVATLHYNEDMSLSEIAELLGVSRQAVHDALRRAAETLSGYEDKLHLAGLFLKQREGIAAAVADLDAGNAASARERLLALTEIL